MHRIAVIPGDGIGPEVIGEACRVLECVADEEDFGLDLVQWDLGADRYLRSGHSIDAAEMAELREEYDGILLGALGDPRVPDHAHARDILLGMRFEFDLYLNMRPARLFDAAHSPLRSVEPDDVDLLIVRENTEGSYVGMGGVFRRGTPQELAIEEDVNTRTGVERIVRAAFDLASKHGRTRVTLADKANAMRHAGDLWRRVFAEVGEEYPGIERDAWYVDALAMDLILHPARYQVIVASNLFGDILSDLAAGLVGGLGLAPSANLHPGRTGLFEPVHGSAPDLAGSNRANPLAAILTAGLLLEQIDQGAAAHRLEEAVRTAIARGETTPDLGGSLGTRAVGEAVCRHLRESSGERD